MLNRKRSRNEPSEWSEHMIKVAALAASPSIVTIVTHHLYVPVLVDSDSPKDTETETEFIATGLIIESPPKLTLGSSKITSTIIAPACLFNCTPEVQLNPIKIDVFGETGKLYKGKLLACDFHYNLAAITIKSKSPLPTASFKYIDDILPIRPTTTTTTRGNTFQLAPHSNLFKIAPGTNIVSVCRSNLPPYCLHPGSGTISSSCPRDLSCNELYEIINSTFPGHDGGPVVNYFGEIIGMIFNVSSFLPSNVISRWWNHYKCSGGFRRPYLGMEVDNLHDVDVDFLAKFIARFPKVSTAVVVTKVEENSPASRSGLCANDVIVNVDGKEVRGKLEFYEQIWEKAGEAVKVNALRVSNSEDLELCLEIEEATPDKFHQWPLPPTGKMLK